ncbi:hypothetical protein EST62_07250 [Chlorobaculum sp. 24CR]|uniref:DUF7687 domain-containing protein n=1 Tax=Chlorobaculum sp. 24CR TaxID=2508878 RepID=UPI00100B12E4|nr:hypothetical protein [Chlorobaculum sp. 24CR]RXK85233.1 hypothetical protein EST62_07250 [Chlorobaculum sp. 24CR]
MIANSDFTGLDLEFWSNIKLLNQRLGYVVRRKNTNQGAVFLIPAVEEVLAVFNDDDLDYSRIIHNGVWTDFGQLIVDYLSYRGQVLIRDVEPNLMNAEEARKVFVDLKGRLDPKCPIPDNKQSGDKKAPAYFTGIINMIIEAHAQGLPCDYDPRELTSITAQGFPVRTLSRRVDGAFPGPINPHAIWEIKEYYYTTTFGSRVADGVYETMLDGFELNLYGIYSPKLCFVKDKSVIIEHIYS